MAVLIIREGFATGTTFRLGQRTLTMGRDAGNLVQIIDDKVSRRHAMVRWNGAVHTLVDLDSYNGVLVNGAKTKEAVLKFGDRIKVGGTLLEVVTDDQIAQDATLARKVTDKGIVAESTAAALPSIGGLDAMSTDAKTGIVEIDQKQANRDVLISQFVFELSSAVARPLPAPACHKKSAEGIEEFLAPDRMLMLQLPTGGRATPVMSRFADGLSSSRRRVPPHMEALRQTVKTMAPVLLNDVPGQSGPDALGSVLAVPVRRIGGPVLGAIYLDSFADNRQWYIEEDAEFLQQVARLLRSTFGP